MSDSKVLMGSNLEKCGFFWKNSRFSGQIRPDWGNAAWADMVRLGAIGLKDDPPPHFRDLSTALVPYNRKEKLPSN